MSFWNETVIVANETLQSGRPVIDVPGEVLIAVGVYLAVVAILATTGNVSFLAVLVRCRALLRDPHMILLMNMAVCDLSISIVGYPFTVASSLAGRWLFGDAVCQMYAFCCYTLSLTSANTLVVVSIFRFIAVCKPEIKHRLTPTVSCLSIAACFMYSLIWTVSPFFGFSSYTYEPFFTSCSFDWYDRTFWGVSYVIGSIVFCYLLHLVVLSCCYYKIHVRVSNMRLETSSLPGSISGEMPIRKRPFCFCCCDLPRHLDKTTKMELEVLQLNVLMVFSFFVIWTPYAVVSIISAFYPDIPAFWYIFPTVFAKTSCMVNPFLYGLTNATLRNEFGKLWRQMRRSLCSSKVGQERDDDDPPHPRRSKRTRQAARCSARPIYNKEALEPSYVNQATCVCRGCSETRREVELVMQSQKLISRQLTEGEASDSSSMEHVGT